MKCPAKVGLQQDEVDLAPGKRVTGIWTLRFEEVCDRRTEQRLTQQEAADLLDVPERQFRQCRRYASHGPFSLRQLSRSRLLLRRSLRASGRMFRPFIRVWRSGLTRARCRKYGNMGDR